MQVEYLSHSHKDIWFVNNQAGPVLLFLSYKSCKCSSVQIGSFDIGDDEWESLVKQPTLTGLCRLASSATFVDLAEGDPNKPAGDTPVAADPQGRTPKPHLFRVNWQAKKPPDGNPELLQLDVEAKRQGGVAEKYTKYVKYQVIPAVGTHPLALDVGELASGGHAKSTIFIFSETRDSLRIKARASFPEKAGGDDPCVTLSEPVELTPTELADFPQLLGKGAADMRLRCAYKIDVAVNERRGDRQLDMGPLVRKIVLEYDTGMEDPIENTELKLSGLVRGEVRLLGGDERDRIALGSFRHGKSVVVKLVAANPKVEIELEKATDERLKPTLSPAETVDGQKQWKLTVEVPKDVGLGELKNALIVLRTKGPNSRLLRIHVTGKAER